MDDSTVDSIQSSRAAFGCLIVLNLCMALIVAGWFVQVGADAHHMLNAKATSSAVARFFVVAFSKAWLVAFGVNWGFVALIAALPSGFQMRKIIWKSALCATLFTLLALPAIVIGLVLTGFS